MKKIILFLICLLPNILFSQAPEWQWASQAGGADTEVGKGIVIDAVGNSYITGQFRETASFGSYNLSTNDRDQMFVAKMDVNGNWLWAIQANGAEDTIGLGIALDDAGSCYVTGSFFDITTFGPFTLTSGGNGDIFVAKIDTDGNWQWVTQAGGIGHAYGESITLDVTGNCYITGIFVDSATFGSNTLTDLGSGDIFVAKIDSNGNWQWASQAGGIEADRAYSIATDDNGTSYVTGWFKDLAFFDSHFLTSIGDGDVFVAKIDSDGSWIWASQAGGVNQDESNGISIDSIGNSLITGFFRETAYFGSHTLISNGENDIFVAKIDSDGMWQWATKAGGIYSDGGNAISSDNVGNSYITGAFQDIATFGSYTMTSSDGTACYILKIDMNGNIQWAVQSDGIASESGYGIVIDNVKNCYVVGYFISNAIFGSYSITSSSGLDIFVAKLKSDSPANFIANRTFGYSPMAVIFTNLFTLQDSIQTWQWDFQNDGVIDSYEQNPTYMYNQPGIYDVELIASYGSRIDSLVRFDYISVDYGNIIDGYAYLENQSDHDSIKIYFACTVPDTYIDSIYTDSNGYYILGLPDGIYDITYSKDNYHSVYKIDEALYSDTTLPDVTLLDTPATLHVPSMYPSIQLAIDESFSGDTILVAPGTYFENINFLGKGITVGSHFITTQDTFYISQTIIDGNQNGSVVTFNTEEDSTSILSGFTITNGLSSNGGGIYCSSSYPDARPSINNVYVINNEALSKGGGIYGGYIHSLKKSKITENVAYGNGGGIYSKGFVDKLEDIMINNNVAHGNGGGLCFTAKLNSHNVSIVGNTAYANGGGISYISLGQVVGIISIDDMLIYNNISNDNGGGLYFDYQYSSPVIYEISNVRFVENTANDFGGGIFLNVPYVDVNLKNLTISKNDSNQGGGIYLSNSSPIIQNTIVSNNFGSFGIYNSNGTPSITYSDCWSNEGGNFYNCDQWTGVNITTNANGDSCDAYFNIQLEPCFADTANNDYHLTANSPCIDAGDPSFPLDPDGSTADMGAYWFYHLDADFTATPSYGFAPLTVNFTDQSIGFPISWEWDFNNDGTIESYEQNPSWTYNDPGNYSVSLTVGDGDTTNTLIIENCIVVYSEGTGTPPETLWTATYGGTGNDTGHCIQQTIDGGFVISGSTSSDPYSTGGQNTWLIKTNANGDTLWQQTYGGNAEDNGYSVLETNDGGYIVCGSKYLTKTDSLGNQLWQQEFYSVNPDYSAELYSVQQTTDNGYIIAGQAASQFLAIKTDDLGSETWRYFDNGPRGRSIVQTYDGNYVAVCSSVNGASGVIIKKIDDSGSFVWENSFGSGFDMSWGYSVKQTSDDGYVIVGYSWLGDNRDIYLIKTNENGSEEWSRNIGGDGAQIGYDVQQTLDNGFIISGLSQSDAYVLRTDENGFEIWNNTYGGTNQERGYSIDQCINGGFVVAGVTQSYGAGSVDFYVIRIDSELNADFYADATWGYEPFNAQFHDSSFTSFSNPNIVWEWDFDDDGTVDSNEQNPTWAYTVPGHYSVSLTLFDGLNSNTETKENYITVLYQGPVTPPDTLWTRTYGGNDLDCGRWVEQTTDQGYIITGESQSYGAGDSDVLLIKTDILGNSEWITNIGSTDDDYGYCVKPTSDNGFIITGAKGGYYSDLYLIKTNNVGDTLWTKAFDREGGREIGYSVEETNDNGFIVTGQVNPQNDWATYIWLMKTDANGNMLWQKDFGDPGGTCPTGYSVHQTSDYGYILLGSQYDYIRECYDAWLIKTDANGDSIWSKKFLTDNDDYGKSVQETSDNGFILAGYTYDGNESEVFLIKTDQLGNTVWSETFSSHTQNTNYSVVETSDEGFLLSNQTYTNPSSSSIYIVRTNMSGSIIWEKLIQESVLSYVGNCIQSSQNSYILTGATNYEPSGDYADVWLIEIGSEIYADFSANPTSGHIPLEVNFNNESIGYPTSWEWDFNNDGTIDSYEQNPIWTYSIPGTYSVALTVSDGTNSDIEIKTDLITVVDSPTIIEIPLDYPTIQEGINAAVEGDTVLVVPGTYVTGINFNGKAITVCSLFYITQDTTYISQTLLTGEPYGSIVEFTSGEDDSSILSGFTISNGYTAQGGGIRCYNSSPTLNNLVISDNTASQYGGGICLSDNSDPNIENVLITNNTSGTNGGGIYFKDDSSPELFNVTIADNSASQNGGGIHCILSSHPTLNNCILWDNSPQEISFHSIGGSNSVTISYTDIEGGQTGIIQNNNGTVNWLEGNINSDPLFADAINGDYQLTENSPCIDTGDPEPIYNDPDNSRADMGAYYFYQFNCDFSSDVTTGAHPLEVNFLDESYGILTSREWDFDNNGTIDSYEQNPSWVYTAPGTYSVSLTITDADSSETETKTDYITVTNLSPVVQTPLGNLTMLEDEPDSTSINLNDHFSDPNGDNLTFSYTGNDSIAIEILQDGSVVFTSAENWFGQETIVFTADDLWETETSNNSDNTDRNTISESKNSLPTKRNAAPQMSESKNKRIKRNSRSTVSDSLVVTVEPVNDIPWFTSIPDTLVMEDEVYQYIATAEDIEGDPLTFAAPVLPSWLTFAPAIGLLVGIPTNNDVGYHPVTITVTDGLIPTPIEQNFIIHVQNFNNPPEITFPANFSFPEDGSATYDFTAYVTDIDNTYEELSLSWENNTNIDIVNDNWDVTFSSNLPEWSGEEDITFIVDDGVDRTRISSNLVLSHSESNRDRKESRKISTENVRRDIVSESITVFCTEVNDPPVLTGWQPQELEFTVFQDSTVNFLVNAYDVDSDLSYNWFLNEILLANELDSIFVHTFSDIGDFGIQSVIADEDNEVGQEWLVHVNEQVNADNTILPVATKLYQNYPNPFNPTTTIRLDIKENEKGILTIFNLKGQIIVSEEFEAGQHSYQWNGNNCSTGLYFYRLRTDTQDITRKMVMMK